MKQMLQDRQKESWKEELQEIERKRTELLAEHHTFKSSASSLGSFA